MSTEPRPAYPFAHVSETLVKGASLEREVAKAVEAEREACAKVADKVLDDWLHHPNNSEIALCEEVAKRIRARKS